MFDGRLVIHTHIFSSYVPCFDIANVVFLRNSWRRRWSWGLRTSWWWWWRRRIRNWWRWGCSGMYIFSYYVDWESNGMTDSLFILQRRYCVYRMKMTTTMRRTMMINRMQRSNGQAEILTPCHCYCSSFYPTRELCDEPENDLPGPSYRAQTWLERGYVANLMWKQLYFCHGR